MPPERSGRQTEKETADAVLDLVRAMGGGDIVEGLGKLEMLQALDEMRCDWMEVLQHGLPELTPKVSSERSPRLIKKSEFLIRLAVLRVSEPSSQLQHFPTWRQ